MVKSSDQVPSGEAQNMGRWASEAAGLTGKTSAFFAALLREEAGKTARLRQLGQSIGLPIYDQEEFRLPEDREACVAAMERVTSGGKWSLAMKISDPEGRVVFRRLGLTERAGTEALASAGDGSTIHLTPYRDPDLSGTLWKRNGELLVEFSRGPHYWLTKWAPSDGCVIRGSVSATNQRLRLTGCADAERSLFARLTQAACRAVFGLDCRAALDQPNDAYAEFHWFRLEGLRFIECSFSSAWNNSLSVSPFKGETT